MQIRQIQIRHFRGIECLDWILKSQTICLIGSNDSTKTTILEAVDYALSSKWNIALSDTDFYQADINSPIEITVTVGELPSKLMSINKFGGYLRGWHSETGVPKEGSDEPSDGLEAVLSIRLSVDSSLEPKWEVICNREEGIRISSTDREQFRISRIGSYVDRDLSWGRGSTLTHVTEREFGLSMNLAEITRKARLAIADTTLDQLAKTSGEVQGLSEPYGVRAKHGFKPAFDADVLSINAGTLTLHDGNIPTRQFGLGSKRLIALAMQKSVTKDGAILLIDEIEHGLEPYRLRQLVRLIRVKKIALNKEQETATDQLDEAKKPAQEKTRTTFVSQTLLTTHSPIALVELHAEELHIVRSRDGITTVTQLSDKFQQLVRAEPEAFLAPRIIVCEGKTEVGLLRAMDRMWASQNDGCGLASKGVIAINGNGEEAPQRAIDLAKLGFHVLFWVDNDKEIQPSRAEVEAAGSTVIQWDTGYNTEKRIFTDLPIKTISKVLDLCLDEDTMRSRLDVIGLKLGMKTSELTLEALKENLSKAEDEAKLRNAIYLASVQKNKEWFKRTDLGEAVGDIIAPVLDLIPTSDLAMKIASIKQWVYGA